MHANSAQNFLQLGRMRQTLGRSQRCLAVLDVMEVTPSGTLCQYLITHTACVSTYLTLRLEGYAALAAKTSSKCPTGVPACITDGKTAVDRKAP